jgi:hypothetical protein
MSDYHQDARADARETVLEYLDDIVEQLQGNGEASDDLYNDYTNGDTWHHECHVDRFYNLQEAAELLDQLFDHTEEDSGVWEGQEPRQAIGTQAAYTYGNAVYSKWCDLIEKINDEYAYWDEEDDEDHDSLINCIQGWISD